MLKPLTEYTYSAEVDAAARAALMPDHDGAIPSSDSSGIIPASSSDLLHGPQYGLASALPNTQDYTVATTTVRSSQLDKIQGLLARGDRRGACHYAADEKLWPHALLIASSIDKDTWKEVVTEWVRAELANGLGHTQGDTSEGREALRVAYSLYGGNGAASGTSSLWVFLVTCSQQPQCKSLSHLALSFSTRRRCKFLSHRSCRLRP